MKKMTTIAAAAAKTTTDALTTIIGCPDIDAENLTANKRLAVLAFAELAKATKTKDSHLILDCNYGQSKNHTSGNYLVTYWRLVSNDTKNQSMVQVYAHPSAKRGVITFSLCTSCAKMNREQFERVTDLQFTVKYNKKTGRAKTSERKGVSYEELPSVLASVRAVLANSASPAPETDAE